MSDQAKKVGRPCTYDPELHPILAATWAGEGKTSPQIAEKLGISESTLYRWAQDHVEFREAVKKGKEPTDAQVTQLGLLRRALGYTYEEKHVEIEDRGKAGTVRKIKTITRHVPPEPVAIFFWLKNRRPDLWRDRAIVKHEGVVRLGPADAQDALLEKMMIEDPGLNEALDALAREQRRVLNEHGRNGDGPGLLPEGGKMSIVDPPPCLETVSGNGHGNGDGHDISPAERGLEHEDGHA